MPNNDKRKILAIRVEPGSLDRVITAYGEAEKADLQLGSGTGAVSTPYIVAYSVIMGVGDSSNEFCKNRAIKISTNQVAMFLQPHSISKSVILLGTGYFIVQDTNLEPVTATNSTEGYWKSWLEQFKRDFANTPQMKDF